MTIKVSEDKTSVCCGANGPRLAFQVGGLCPDCCAWGKERLCTKLPCAVYTDKWMRLGNYQEVKS
jgi:hypothetical protein